MRVLFTVLPAESHLRPMLPLADELASRGWEVAFAGAASMEEQVQPRGFGFFPVGLDWLEAEAAQTFAELRTMPLDEQAYWWVTDLFADRVAKPAATDLVRVIDAWDPEVVVRDYWDFGAWAAAEARGVVTAVVGLAMFTPSERFNEFIGPQLRELRAHVGLGQAEHLRSLYSGPYIDLLPASYQVHEPPGAVRMASLTVAGPSEDPAFDWEPDQAQDPTVLVTFGTVFNRVPGVFETTIEALADLPVNAVITTGRNRDPADLGPLPTNILATEFVPYATLLPDCDAVVCHSGMGTTMAALAHDLPIAALPISADQFVHAERCEQLGVGRVVPPPERSSATVRTAITEVLNDPQMRRRAADLGRELRSMPGPGHAADLLERAARAT